MLITVDQLRNEIGIDEDVTDFDDTIELLRDSAILEVINYGVPEEVVKNGNDARINNLILMNVISQYNKTPFPPYYYSLANQVKIGYINVS